MPVELLITILLILVGFIILAIVFKKWITDATAKQRPNEELLAWLKNTNQRLDEQNQHITSTLQSSTKALNERLDKAAQYIGAVQKNIGEMSEIGRGMKELQDFLKSPKLRGNIGEQILKELLSQMLPKQSFHLQYTFKSGAIVDAAIQTANGIIPVDSKFPMENFRKLTSSKTDEERKNAGKEFERDIKKHIDDISRKYILTDEGTIDYALMYIPSESVYYEVVNRSDLFDYASEKRVLPVSPTTFYAYMKAILMSFEGQKIGEQAKQILQTIKAMQKDYTKVEESLLVLSRHINNAYNQMSAVYTGFTQLGQKLTSSRNFDQPKGQP